MAKSVTISEIAKRAEVSRTTASLILNDRGADRFSQQTRQRVRRIADQLAFRPRQAPSPSAPQTGLISWLHSQSIVAVDRERTYRGALLEAVVEAADAHHFHVAVRNGFNGVEDVQRYVDTRCRGAVDGILLAGPMSRDVQDFFAQQDVPTVFIGDGAGVYGRLNGVYTDSFQGGRMAARHLHELGHTRALVTCDHSLPFTRHRLLGFREEFILRGLPADNAVECTPHSDGFVAQLKVATQGDAKATALYVSSGDVAMHSLAALKHLQLRVPDDLSVVSHDEWPENEMVDPPLTTVENSRRRLGAVAVQRLLDVIDEPNSPPVSVMVPNQLKLRRSTAPPAAHA